jgi:ribonuclease T2
MKKITLILLTLLPLGCNTTPTPTPVEPPNTGISAVQTVFPNQPFDYYLLNLSWSPEFCATHATAPECAQHLGFVLHGLWPQNNNQTKRGPYLENCSTDPGPSDPSKYKDIYPDPGLLRHEWKTHGTCSGLAPDAFFNLARTAFHSLAIPATLTQLTQQISMPPDQIIGLFKTANPHYPAASFALSCGNNYLTAIEVCLNKSAQPIPCGPIKSCRAQTVRIPPP